MNRLLCLFVVLGLAAAQSAQAARLQPSVIVGKPEVVAPPAAAPQPSAPPVVITVPAPTASASCCPEKCCPTPCITYRSKGERRSCLDDKPSVSVTVAVKNPQTGCCVNVPICLPCCCLDEPCIDSRCGMFHRGIVTYNYKCGLDIVFVFDRCGDLLVTYLY